MNTTNEKKTELFLDSYLVIVLYLLIFLPAIPGIDTMLLNSTIAMRSELLTGLILILDNGGSLIFWIAATIFISFNNKKISTILIATILIDIILTAILKFSFARPRPTGVVALAESFGHSFPSGHSTLAFSGATVLSNYYQKFTYLFFFLATLIAIGRTYLGVHYPTDILIGALNGVSVALLVQSKISSALRL